MEAASGVVVSFAFNAAWQAAIVALAAALGCRLMGGRPRAQHVVWQVALLMSVGLPLLTVAALPPESPSSTAARVTDSWSTIYWRWMPQLDALAMQTIAVFFLAACVFRLILLLTRMGELQRTLKRGRVTHDPGVERIGALCGRALGLRGISVRSVPGLASPAAAGLTRPMVLLPEGFEAGADDDVLLAAIAHEAAHVARRDYALNLAGEALLCLLGPHPIADVLRQRLEQTREMACDDLVATKILDDRRYARCLVRIAEDAHRRRQLAPALGVTDGEGLKQRVQRLLSNGAARGGVVGLRVAWPALLMTTVGILGSVAAIQPVPSFNLTLPEIPAPAIAAQPDTPASLQDAPPPPPPPRAWRGRLERADYPPPPPPPPPPPRIVGKHRDSERGDR